MADTQVDETIIGKITISAIGCNPSEIKVLKPDDPKLQNGALPLARLYGKLNEVRYQADKDKGVTYVFFVGSFEAVNMQTGEVFRSGKMFLPKGISELVEAAVNKNPNAAIGFAFEVRAVQAKNPAGYTYQVLALKSPEAEDELQQIRELVRRAGTIDTKRLTGSQSGTGPKTIEGSTKKSA
jgi:hypothetical protein